MLFNSLQFLVFFPVVVILYWICPVKARNALLLVASYYFYMNWEPVYALLILFSTVTTWAGALWLARTVGKTRRAVLITTLIVNFGILFTYKYLDFAGDILRSLLHSAGLGLEIPTFELLLPVGISFYTFQAVGYIVDVWRGTLPPEKNLGTYALFVAFFPQLVAGPIERAKNLLPQFHERHRASADLIISGLQMMIVGYFMKLSIADSVSPYVDAVFNNLPMHNGNSILLALFFFTFQIFGDFGGYSLIAIGAARCMGFSLMQNFRQPYLAVSIKDFWRRWHISLSTWFTDYVYIPLGGNRVKPARHYGNLLATFFVSGLWHGANYTFIAWGAYHGMLQCVNVAKRKVVKSIFPDNLLFRMINIACTFVLVMLGWLLFRANNISDAMTACSKIFTERGMLFNGEGKPAIVLPLLMIGVLMVIEILRESRLTSTGLLSPAHPIRRVVAGGVLSGLLLVLILLTAQFHGGQFIYFQF